jgi:hypothetical protein
MTRRLMPVTCAALVLACANFAMAQSTAFTYQGSLTNAGAPASGSYDFQFKLYDSASGGTLLGTVTILNVAVEQGIFATNIDFGSQFTGANRWVQISTRASGAAVYTPLSERQQVLASPYAMGLSLPNVGVASALNGAIRVSNTVGPAVQGTNSGSAATTSAGVVGISTHANGNGVAGFANSGQLAYGVYGEAFQGSGVNGYSQSGNGVYAASQTGAGVSSSSVSSFGVLGVSTQSAGLRGVSEFGAGVDGTCSSGPGVHGQNTASTAVTSAGVLGDSVLSNGNGVAGIANTGASAYGVYGQSSTGYAGYFAGNVLVSGTLGKSGGSFKIDHPLDPANKYLYHSFVESPDMMNVYNGVVTTDARGYAVVVMPEWFETLNRDFRYQLTVVDQGDSDEFVQAKIVGGGMRDGQFSVRTSAPNTMVSWQVTGIRQDAWANAHRIPVEEEKPESERGHYLHPELYGRGPEAGMEAAKVDAAVSVAAQEALVDSTPRPGMK